MPCEEIFDRECKRCKKEFSTTYEKAKTCVSCMAKIVTPTKPDTLHIFVPNHDYYLRYDIEEGIKTIIVEHQHNDVKLKPVITTTYLP